MRNIHRNNLLSIECFTFCNNTLVNNFGFVKEIYTTMEGTTIPKYYAMTRMQASNSTFKKLAVQ